MTSTAAEEAALEKQIHEILQMITKLDSQKGAISGSYCTYDVGARAVGPHGINGMYVRQCKNAAIEGTTPLLCHSHARKGLLRLIVMAQSALMRYRKQPIRTTSGAEDIYDPRTILITGAEVDALRASVGSACTATVISSIQDGGVFGRSDAICKALGPRMTA